MRRLRSDNAFRAALLLCILVPMAYSQVAIDTWTVDQGLPQNIIRGICQSPDGYLWLATFNGLVRFDGVRFTTFDRSNSTGIRGNRFSSLVCTPDGDIWAGTEGSGITRYTRGRFHTYSLKDGLLSDDISGLSADSSGKVWVLAGGSLHEWRAASGRFVVLKGQHYQYAEPLDGAPAAGFWRIEANAFQVFLDGSPATYPLPSNWAHGTHTIAGVDLSRNVWIASPGGKFAKLVHGRWLQIYGRRASSRSPDDGVRIDTEYRDSQGQIWNGTIRISQRTGLTESLNIPISPQTHATVKFTSLFEDRENNIWLSTDGQGLVRLQKQRIRVYSEREGLPDRNVYNIYQTHDGALWFGTWAGGLCQYKNGQFQSYTTRNGLASNRISCVFEDRSGVLWVAVEGGLYRLRASRFEAVRGTPAIENDMIRAIFQDRSGAIWFGTSRGLWRLFNGQWTSFSKKGGLATDDVRAIIQARGDDLWIGGYGGLSLLSPHSIHAWTEQDGLPSNTIRALYQDADGVLWIGTYDGGLGRFQNGKFTRFTHRQGLANNGVFQILEDDRRNLWMSSNHGIYRVSKAELNEFAAGKISQITSIAFGKSDGLRNPECNGGLGPAGVKARDGRLWFPTQDGVAVIRPDDLGTRLPAPPVVIESCLLDRASVPATIPVHIKPGQTNLEIQYTALSLVNSSRIRFRYRLQGSDKDWIEAGTRRTAFYSHLPPGSYVFSVTAAHGEGEWSKAPATLDITVLPPFYRTAGFLAFSSLLILFALWLVWRRRIRHLEQAAALHLSFSRQLIASQEMERKRLAAELHDSLGQRLIIIKNLALLLLHSNGTGQLQPSEREKVEEISSEVTGAVSEVKEISYNLRPYRLDRLGLTVALQSIIDSASSASEIHFSAELDHVDNLLPKDAEINFYRIVQECINNVLKHSGAMSVIVHVRQSEGKLHMMIRDDGKGFATDRLAPHSRSGGFGLTGIAERAELLGGKAVIHSAPGQGTTVSVEIDLP